KEWTVGTTEQHAARCSTTSASPSRSASSLPPRVTMIKTAFSPMPELIVSFSRAVEPNRAREQRDRAEEQSSDHVRFPVHVEVKPIEEHQHDDCDRADHGNHTHTRRRRQIYHP